MTHFIVGIDEAGRGPLAGPVAVGVCMAPSHFDFSVFGVLKDSKKLSEKRRKEVFDLVRKLKKEKVLDYAVALVPHSVIDGVGIVASIQKGIDGCLAKIHADDQRSFVYLDGGLKAPPHFRQETIVKGDEKIPVISLASVVAKVTRDAYMSKVAPGYPDYSFGAHKGYGTLVHQNEIRKNGLCPIHRRTFCTKFKK